MQLQIHMRRGDLRFYNLCLFPVETSITTRQPMSSAELRAWTGRKSAPGAHEFVPLDVFEPNIDRDGPIGGGGETGEIHWLEGWER